MASGLLDPNYESPSLSTVTKDVHKKRRQITVACNECRRRKKKVPLQFAAAAWQRLIAYQVRRVQTYMRCLPEA